VTATEKEKECLNSLYGRELTETEFDEAIRNLMVHYTLLMEADNKRRTNMTQKT
jgi:hypothetical protein